MWHSYSKRAAEGGIADEVIAAIAERHKPSFTRGEDQAVYDYATELLHKHHVSDATFRAALAAVGKVTIVELTALIGNYSMVAMVLNAFQVDMPKDAKPLPA
jgi:4-carboxymuconolactone decarboxylase